jgi:hypothetical protein
MSRLIDKITKSRQSEPQPMGFMLSKTAPEKTRLQLVASVGAEILEKCTPALAKADALILDIARADDVADLEKASQVKDGPAAGGRLKATSAGTLKKAINSGCDFVIISIQAPINVTRDEKLGKVLEVSTGLTDTLLRTVGELPVDAVIAIEKEVEDVLTLNRLMELQRIVFLINKPLLVSVPLSFNSEELQALYDTGVSGVVVEVTEPKDAEKLADLREAIGKIKKTARKKDKMGAVLPRLQSETPQPEGEEEEDE